MTVSAASIIKKLLVLFLIFAGLHFTKDFLMPLTISGVLATLFLPFCKWMEGKKIPKALAALICLLVFLIGITGVIALLGWQVSALTSDFALAKQKVLETGTRIQEFIFNHVGVSASKQSQILSDEQPSLATVMQFVAGSLTYFLTTSILVLAYIFLLLYYRIHIQRFIIKLTPPAQQKEMGQIVSGVTRVSQQYLLGLSKMIACLWIMYSIGFALMGVKNALFFAVLCGLLEIVPFIGNITGTSLTLLVAAVQGASLPMLVGIAGIYGLVQLIQGWLLEPLILGPQVKINPFTTIIALVLGEMIWGLPGIFLAIPVTAMFKIVCDHFESLKPYGYLIGEIENGKKEPMIIKKIKTLVKSKLQK